MVHTLQVEATSYLALPVREVDLIGTLIEAHVIAPLTAVRVSQQSQQLYGTINSFRLGIFCWQLNALDKEM